MPFLEMFMLHAACDNPWVLLMPGALLPLLRQKAQYTSCARQKAQAAFQKEVCLHVCFQMLCAWSFFCQSDILAMRHSLIHCERKTDAQLCIL